MATEATTTAEGERDVRQGPPAAIPGETLAAWFAHTADEHAGRAAALVKRGGEYESVTFAELHEEARQVAGGLQSLGLGPGDRLAIQSETRYEWSVVDVASHLAGIVLVPVYPTFSPKQSAYVVEDCGAEVLVTETPGDVSDEVAAVLDEVVDIADPPTADPADLAGEDRAFEDLATMLYTSGTTGDPKGVELTHRNVRAELALLDGALPDHDPGQRGSCFLPLSHIYQRAYNYYLWHRGHATVFMSVDTLLEDLTATEPQFLGTVPRVYRRMYDGLQEQVADMSGPKRRLVEWGIDVASEYGAALEDRGAGPSAGLRARHALADRLVFSTLREEFGLTNVEYAITGAASLDADLLRFFWGMGVPLLEVYGATETTGGVTFNRMDAFRAGTVGKPLPETEVKLAADEEVLVRGPTIMKRYWNLPEETDDSLRDGWYHTGDLGRWDGEYVRIVDRKKHMQVLDTGENVYSDPLEETLRRQDHISEALVEAENRKYVTALVQPNFDALLSFADDRDIGYDGQAVETEGDETVAVPEPLLEQQDVEALFDREVGAANEDLPEYERVRKYHVLSRAFSVEREELTPTLKKRRRDIRDHFAAEIEAMYET
jgi:long-chain acyl-CoA synthetase